MPHSPFSWEEGIVLWRSDINCLSCLSFSIFPYSFFFPLGTYSFIRLFTEHIYQVFEYQYWLIKEAYTNIDFWEFKILFYTIKTNILRKDQLYLVFRERHYTIQDAFSCEFLTLNPTREIWNETHPELDKKKLKDSSWLLCQKPGGGYRKSPVSISPLKLHSSIWPSGWNINKNTYTV